MEFLDSAASFLLGISQNWMLALAVPFTLLLYAFGRKEELSWHAIKNTAATIVVLGINLVFMVTCNDEINAVAQAAYAALHIPRLNAGFWQTTPIWLVAIIGLASKDFADYVVHRVMHTTWFWPTHAAHHSDTHVNLFTTFRVHYLEVVMMSVTYILLLTWMQMPEVIPIATTLSLAHNMYVHVNLDIEHGPFRYLIASPRFHRWHHADAPEAYGKNLANMIPLWDVIFGTYHVPGRCDAPMGALKAGIEDKNPFLIWIYPFQEWRRLIGLAVGRAARSDRPPNQPARDVSPAE